ncbi:Lovastatin nonaketide synthase 4 [Colletotrichum chlorophyti]|uniref:Lovastatin nonaketide synthase 4 n=1 Tax=Colletotrichum chlorophyti TaxID=708187 RepID=A0A1Q8S0E3_9PEZI|nr:Lovastatin nonaketide synthase 4 [Colletotrichum chlorophyti]
MSASPTPAAPIAICGMGLRLPGGIRTPEDLYNFLLSGADARGLPDKARYNAQAFTYQTAAGHGLTTLPSEGYWLDWIELSSFDPSLFPMSQNQAEKLDPRQRLLLRVAWEAMESAGETDWRGRNFGCYVGSFGDDWRDLHARDALDPAGYRLFGYMDYALSNRISSSESHVQPPGWLYTWHVKPSERASATPRSWPAAISSSRLTSVSSWPSRASSLPTLRAVPLMLDGYARAEAVNCLFIKRHDLALRDGNPIRAIIRGSATNADGSTVGMSTPSPEAQEALIRSAYRMAGINNLCDTAMVECHGTGTAVGDAVETCAIARVFEERGVVIGSLKLALGHSECASALTSVMEAVLSLEHRTIIPNIKFESPSLRLPLKSGRLTVPTAPQPWPSDRKERISINTFEIGGTNVHIILDSASSECAPEQQPQVGPASPLTPPHSSTTSRKTASPTLLLFSAGHEESLRKVAEQNIAYSKFNPGRTADMSYTLALRRLHQPLRSCCVVDENGNPHTSIPGPCIRSSPHKSAAGIVFVFTGQGASWPRMGVDLLKSDPLLLQDIRAMDAVLKSLPPARRPAWTIQGEILRPSASSRLSQAEFSQPVCAALQIALVRRLERHGVIPGAVLGHSSGEIAAAYAAGILSLGDAITAAYYRCYVCRNSTVTGGMISVGMGHDRVSHLLVPEVSVACENSNGNVTLSGPIEALEKVTENIRAAHPDAFIRRLRVNNAYHSSFMAAAADEYLSLLQSVLHPTRPSTPFYSSVLGTTLCNSSDFSPTYWRDNMVSPVLFRQTVKCLLSKSSIEIGPHPALSGPLKQIGTEVGVSPSYASLMSHGASATVTFLSALGELHCRGIPVKPPIPQDAKILGDLPPYPWNLSKTYWSESRVTRAWRFRAFASHELLGTRSPADTDVSPTWRCMLSIDDMLWMKDRCVGSDVVFPAAAYVAMAGEVVFQLAGSRSYTIRELSIKTALVLEPGHSIEILTSVRPTTEHSEWREFNIQSCRDDVCTVHCSGLLRQGQISGGPRVNTEPPDKFLRAVDTQIWYRATSRVGYKYGPEFRGLEDIRASISSPSVQLLVRHAEAPPGTDSGRKNTYALHPKTVDNMFQSLVVAMHSGQPRFVKRLSLPTYVEEIFVNGDPATGALHVHATATTRCNTGPGKSRGDLHAYSEMNQQGALCFYAKGFVLSPAAIEEPDLERHGAIRMVWKPDIDLTPPSSLLQPQTGPKHAQIQELLKTFSVLCAICIRAAAAALPTDTRKTWASHFDFNGSASVLDLFLQDNTLHGLYDWKNSLWSYERFLELVAHQKGNHLRILEIGAGTGGLTARVLRHLRLKAQDGKVHGSYVFTDVSAGFFGAAKERFADCSFVEYRVLDINQDPMEQGFRGEYDLIIASNVLHVISNVTKTLRHVRSLLKPDGRLLMQELACGQMDQSDHGKIAPAPSCFASEQNRLSNPFQGFLPGWWLGEPDGREEEPYMKPAQWKKRLLQAGSSPPEAAQVNATIVARPAQTEGALGGRPLAAPFVIPEMQITLLHCDHDVPGKISHFKALLAQQGYRPRLAKFGDALQPGPVISLLDLSSAEGFFTDMSQTKLEQLYDLLGTLKRNDDALLWLT